jgi:GMP synthase-like glutamine amidotransferase
MPLTVDDAARRNHTRFVTRALVIQHVEPERPALLGEALQERGCRIEVVHAYRGEAVPTNIASYGALVILGGPMSAGSDEGFTSRRDELALIADAAQRRRPILGICLGAQLLAVAAGSAIRRGREAEIGWGTVQLSSGAVEDPLFGALDREIPVLHWHRETFDVPAGAVHIAGSALYEAQAYRVGDLAWGLQFHVEVDRAAVERLVTAFPEEAAAAPAGAARILAGAEGALERMSAVQTHVLGGFADLVALRGAGGAGAVEHDLVL